jgi:hypothetical protein
VTAQSLAHQQRAFFDTFGYVVLRGALRDDVTWILAEFAAVFRDLGVEHTGERRSAVVPFIDQRPRLAGLLEHDVVEGALASLLGPDFNYLGSDGNLYAGDTAWHSDGTHASGRFAKLALYLDPVRADSGALRVIPGSHRLGPDEPVRQAGQSEAVWGTSMSDVPSVTLDSDPGDLVIFDHNLMHASFGGSASRRMFTINTCSRARTHDEVRELEEYIGLHASFGLARLYGRTVREASPARRMIHLEQCLSLDGGLAERAASTPADAKLIGWEATL